MAMSAPIAPPPYLDLGALARADGVVALPGSKSISNRTLLLAALALGRPGLRVADASPAEMPPTGIAPVAVADLPVGSASPALEPTEPLVVMPPE